MQDGMQNVSFDRILIRVKDMCQIAQSVISMISSLVSMVVMVIGGLWICFTFISQVNKIVAVVSQQTTVATSQQAELASLREELRSMKSEPVDQKRKSGE